MKTLFALFAVVFFLSACKAKINDTRTIALKDSLANEKLRYVVLFDTSIIHDQLSTWIPTSNQIESIKVLSRTAVMESQLKNNRHIKPDSLLNYYRQYVCYIRDGDSIVLINAFCEAGERIEEENNGSVKILPFNWQREFRQVSDGGSCYWKAMINFSKKKVEWFSINGKA